MRTKRIRPWTCFIVVLLAALTGGSPPAYAQSGTTTSVSGTVVDTSGAVVPGADVTIKNNGTGAVYTTVTAENGTFSVPGINPGTYSVTVTLMGFKTHVVPELPVAAGVPAAVRCVLDVGQLEETVVVAGGAEIVQTAVSAVATTLSVTQITNLPLSTRDMTNFVSTMPGVDVASGTRDANVNGLPQGQINITIDGVNVQDNTLKTSDGFFALVSPRLDAMEEMTFSSAAQGADAASQGAVQMRFTTRSGSNRFAGSAYYYFQHDKLNTNTYFNIRDNIPKAALNLKQPGGRLGGPIVRDRAFFFFNYEEYRRPSARTTNSTILHPRAEQGWFRYLGADGSVQEVNVLDEARKLGLTDTIDPIIGKLLTDIRQSTTTTGTLADLADPRFQRFTFAQPTDVTNRFPTGRLDFNLTQSHRLSASSNYSSNSSFPDTTNGYWAFFPDFPVILGQSSRRRQYQVSMRSVFGKSLVNEARYGGSGGKVLFYPEYNLDMLSGSKANQGGFVLQISAAGITNPGGNPTPQARDAPAKTFEDTVTWLKGKHSIAFGGAFTQFDYWGWMDTLAPSVSFGLVQGDPALGTLFAGRLSGSNLTNAQNLYAVLTGRISAINGNVRLDENTGVYEYLGKGMSRAQLRQMDFFAQDSWRIRSNLTVNYGARYSLQLPFVSLNSSYSYATMEDVWGITGVAPDFKPSVLGRNLGYLFQPGVLKGKPIPEFQELKKGQTAFETDWNNIAPSLGFNWTPSVKDGFLRRLLGDTGDTSISGGYSVAYQRPGLSDFTGVVGANPGVSVTTNRTQSLGNLADPTGAPGPLPLLLRETNRLGPPAFSTTRVYPMYDVITQDVNIFDPNLQVPYAATYTVGVQRAVSRTMAVSVRYVGTRNKAGWTEYDYNETNIIENGFLDEFKKAQANLQANIAAGRGNTFAYTGVPGTSPLPIYLAYFQGLPASAAGNSANYTSSSFRNSSYYNYLALTNPNPFSAAGTGTNGLQGNQTLRSNAVNAGLPRNFFVVNPDLLGGANVTGNGGYTKYNSIQVELRRRMSQGLQFNLNYVFGRSWGSSRYSFRVDRLPTRQTGGGGGIEHALKANWVYELPIGQGRRFLGGVGSLVDHFVGGWQVHGVTRLQSGRLLDFGNVRLVGMTSKDLQRMFKVRVAENRQVWMLPQDVIDNTVRAYSWSATDPSGYTRGVPEGRYIAPAQGPGCIESISSSYGDCGTRSLVITGPVFWTLDLSVAKQFRIKGRTNFDFRAEMFNVFDRTNFTPVTGLGSSPSGYEVTGATSGRTVQLVWRLNF